MFRVSLGTRVLVVSLSLVIITVLGNVNNSKVLIISTALTLFIISTKNILEQNVE